MAQGKSKQLNEAGFTLLETLIALSVVVVGALGVFALMQRTILATEANKQSIITVNLAREGLEIVRSLRDSSSAGFGALLNGNWLVDSQDYYNISVPADAGQLNQCSNCRLYLNNSLYTNTPSSELTAYRRLVNISDGSSFPCGGSCEKIITVYVLGSNRSQPFVLREHLTDWR